MSSVRKASLSLGGVQIRTRHYIHIHYVPVFLKSSCFYRFQEVFINNISEFLLGGSLSSKYIYLLFGK